MNEELIEKEKERERELEERRKEVEDKEVLKTTHFKLKIL